MNDMEVVGFAFVVSITLGVTAILATGMVFQLISPALLKVRRRERKKQMMSLRIMNVDTEVQQSNRGLESEKNGEPVDKGLDEPTAATTAQDASFS
jgi:hypothetical protein